ncbi:hypothetical protein, partial [Acinetobacter baumannii]|uniref:hypothetical protein n=1 Tax=Acinetobacter baumannii TaxID=470 RepID=UPI00196A12DA
LSPLYDRGRCRSILLRVSSFSECISCLVLCGIFCSLLSKILYQHQSEEATGDIQFTVQGGAIFDL